MTDRGQRKLAAMLVADVVGFSRMMEANEAVALTRLRAARSDVVEPAAARSNGRIVKTTGDGFLIEFGSAVEAVECAIAIQKALVGNACRILLRIGVNIGDVVVEEGDVFGDGVNVAARLEPLAPAGGVLISDNVAEQIRGRVMEAFADLGLRSLKNIDRQVRLWQWPADAKPSPTAVPLDMRGRDPVIAVLPFQAATGDAELEGFSLGLTNGLVQAVSSWPGTSVLGRAATAVLDQRDFAAIPADYVLFGAIRRQHAHVRVNAELVEIVSGRQIWSTRFDQVTDDFFALEDEVVERIAAPLRAAININDGRRLDHKSELTNADRRSKATQHFYLFSAQGFCEARTLLDDVLASDPNDAMATAMLAFCYLGDVLCGGVKLAASDIGRALELAERAVELNRASDYAYETRGLLALHFRGDCQAALADAKRALLLNPQYALAMQLHGEALIHGGQVDEGIAVIRKVIEIDARDPTLYYRYAVLARGHYLKGEDAKAVEAIERATQGAMRLPIIHMTRVAILMRAGKSDEARAEAARVCRHWPDLTLGRVSLLTFRDEDRARFIDRLREAGLPD
jgi:adenylate cyclase